MGHPQKIVILGGGSAGWMAANLLAVRMPAVQITLIASEQIGTLGVGEGSTPHFRQFFTALGLAESEWMPACHASYKTGIHFPGWAGEQQDNSYFHPFYAEADAAQVYAFFAECQRHQQGLSAAAHPDAYFVNYHLSRGAQAPVGAATNSGIDSNVIDYGYHFDAVLLGEYLGQLAKQRGVRHVDAKVTQILSSAGGIQQLILDNGEKVEGDLFIDCSGFAGLLIHQHLGREYCDLSHRLFNNAAVAVQTPHSSQQALPSATFSRAINNGWVWQIPLSQRWGNGYVYCDSFISPAEAEQELAHFLQLDPEGQQVRHLRWRPSRLEQHWYQNCVALGMSQGFLEPLEAPMLHIIQSTLELLLEHLQTGALHMVAQQRFNHSINQMIEGTCDYLQAHYKLNGRQESDYWQEARANPQMSSALEHILALWHKGQPIEAAMRQYPQLQAYGKTSWLCLFAGLSGTHQQLRESPSSIVRNAQAAAKALALPFPDHLYRLRQLQHRGASRCA